MDADPLGATGPERDLVRGAHGEVVAEGANREVVAAREEEVVVAAQLEVAVGGGVEVVAHVPQVGVRLRELDAAGVSFDVEVAVEEAHVTVPGAADGGADRETRDRVEGPHPDADVAVGPTDLEVARVVDVRGGEPVGDLHRVVLIGVAQDHRVVLVTRPARVSPGPEAEVDLAVTLAILQPDLHRAGGVGDVVFDVEDAQRGLRPDADVVVVVAELDAVVDVLDPGAVERTGGEAPEVTGAVGGDDAVGEGVAGVRGEVLDADAPGGDV